MASVAKTHSSERVSGSGWDGGMQGRRRMSEALQGMAGRLGVY